MSIGNCPPYEHDDPLYAAIMLRHDDADPLSLLAMIDLIKEEIGGGFNSGLSRDGYSPLVLNVALKYLKQMMDKQ